MQKRASLSIAFALCACGAVRSTPDTQGVSVDPGPCGRGLLVLESDYQSSNVSALDFQGNVLSQSLDSSSTVSGGFGVGLSGAAVLPFPPQAGPQIVVIDSYPAGSLDFLDPTSARVTAELSVTTGFKSNPHDYLPLSEHQGYVARYNANANPGQQDFDQGADVLIVDPSVPSVTGRIDLSPAMKGVAQGFSAHPTQFAQAFGRVFVLLAAYADDYSSAAPSRLVEIDPSTNTLLETLVLGSLRGCDGMALSPDGTELAVSCTGDDLASTVPKLSGSGIALVDISNAPKLGTVFEAAELGTDVVGFGLDYVADSTLLYSTLGHFDDSGAVGALDGLWRLETSRATVTEVLRSKSQPFTLGAVRCTPACGACFATDAERGGGSVQVFPIDGAGQLGAPATVHADTRLGLPPRYLGVF
jgi:hypothetical protein